MNEQDLTDLLRAHASANGVPGAVIGVVRDGVQTLAACGVADVTTSAPVTAASRFGVG